MALLEIKKFVEEKAGFSLSDRNDLPTSTAAFPGGAHYRMEVPGIEKPSNFETLAKESEKRNIPIHRIIAAVGGSALLDNRELRYFAEMGAALKTEIIINPAPTRGWDTGRQYTTSEGYVSGMRIRGQENLYLWLKEFDRCLSAGIRGFLVPDEGLLSLLNQMRSEGVIPADVKFKVSVFAGHGNAVGGKLLENLGADSFNPLADLSLPMLAAIRDVIRIPLDVYISIVDSMGGFQRHLMADEIVRICAPVYLKFEPGKSEAELYNAWTAPDHLDYLVKMKVKYADICRNWCERSSFNLVFNDYAEDLSVPKQ